MSNFLSFFVFFFLWRFIGSLFWMSHPHTRNFTPTRHITVIPVLFVYMYIVLFFFFLCTYILKGEPPQFSSLYKIIRNPRKEKFFRRVTRYSIHSFSMYTDTKVYKFYTNPSGWHHVDIKQNMAHTHTIGPDGSNFRFSFFLSIPELLNRGPI